MQSENARRMAVYQTARQAWQLDDDLLHRAAELARTAGPVTPPAGPKLRRNEHVLWAADGVSMVEMPDTISLFAPLHTAFSPTRQSGAYAPLAQAPASIRDTGLVAVTNQRIVFMGRRSNRDWDFAQLTGVAHGDATPMTLMRVANRQRLSGLVFPGDSAPAFQFFLSLGLAEYQGDRVGFVAHLGGLRAHHQLRRPAVPQGALPEQASRSLKWLVPVAAAAVTVVCVGAVFAAAALPDPSPPDPARVAAPATSRTTVVETTSAIVPSATVAEPMPEATTVTPATTAPAPPPPAPPKPPATSKAPSLCGAPANPWGYNFCSGSKIYNPPGDFCAYFSCIDNFWKSTNGFVAQCKDGMFSHSGGRSGVCSYHGGFGRALYSR